MISSVYASVNLFHCISCPCSFFVVVVEHPTLVSAYLKARFRHEAHAGTWKSEREKRNQHPNAICEDDETQSGNHKSASQQFIGATQLTISIPKFRSLKMQSEHEK